MTNDEVNKITTEKEFSSIIIHLNITYEVNKEKFFSLNTFF